MLFHLIKTKNLILSNSAPQSNWFQGWLNCEPVWELA